MRMDRSLWSPRAWRWLLAVAALAAMLSPAQAHASAGTGLPVSNYSGLTASQQATLLSMARDTWKFYSVDVDPGTHLPLDNVSFAGGSAAQCAVGRVREGNSARPVRSAAMIRYHPVDDQSCLWRK